jgi:heme exporter protein D
MSDFLIMDGDGAYVWSAYGITLIALVFSYWSAKRCLRLSLEQARQHRGPSEPTRTPTVREM